MQLRRPARANNSRSLSEVEQLLEQLAAEEKPDPEVAGQPFYEAADGADPVATSIWARLDVGTIKSTVDELNRTIGGLDPATPNGHLELGGVFLVSEGERVALANVGGSAMVH